MFDDVGPESARALSGVLLRNVLKVEDIDDPLPIGTVTAFRFVCVDIDAY